MRDWLLSTWKYVASFRKREWTLEDYPVRVTYQEGTGREFKGWVAQIEKWWLVGTGPTQDEALKRLRANLAAAKREGNHPRPGTRPPIKFAAAHRLELYGDFAYEFVERVTGRSPMFMSDETSLTDFADGAELEEVVRKISLIYDIDARAMVERPLWQLLEQVRPQKRPAPQANAGDEAPDD